MGRQGSCHRSLCEDGKFMFFNGLYGGEAPLAESQGAGFQALPEDEAVMVCALWPRSRACPSSGVGDAGFTVTCRKGRAVCQGRKTCQTDSAIAWQATSDAEGGVSNGE